MTEEGSLVKARERKTGRDWDKPLEEDLLFRVLQRLETEKGWADRPVALAWLRNQARDIALDDRLRNAALKALSRMAAGDDPDSLEIIREIWRGGWEDRPQEILNHVLQVIKREGNPLKHAASDWLGQMASKIAQHPRLMMETLEELLKILEDKEADNLPFRESALEAIEHIWEEAWQAGEKPWKSIQENGDQNMRWSAVKAIQRFWEASWRYRPQKVIDGVEDALKTGEWDLRRAAAGWVKNFAAEIVKEEEHLHRIQSALLEMGDVKKDRPPDVSRILKDALTGLWEAGWAIMDNRKTRRYFVLQQVLAALRESQEIEIQKAAIDWLGEKARDIAEGENAYGRYKPTADTLVACRVYFQKGSELEGSLLAPSRHRSEMQQMLERVDIVLRRLWEDLSQTQYKRHRDLLLDPKTDEDTKTTAIWRLADRNTLGSREALRFLVGEWIRWVRQDKEPHLVELTAEVIRYNPYAVLALIGYFGNPMASNVNQPPDRARSRPGDDHDFAGNEAAGQTSTAIHPLETSMDAVEAEHLRDHVKDWIENDRRVEGLLGEAELEEAEAFLKRNPAAGAEFRKNLEHLVIESRSALEKEKLLWVDFRIARQLADMSDPAFFEDLGDETLTRIRKEEYKRILQELKKHAIPVVLERMSMEEENGKIPHKIRKIKNGTRAHIVRLLGYTGGREAVDALARQVVGKEKQRKDRHELLDKYYLEPSLKRGEEAADILNATILESERTLSILKTVNTLVFLIGLALLAFGFYISMQGNSDANRLIGGLSVAGGFAGIIALLVRTPLEQIQNAMARLVHAETAFTSFIWQLNLHGTFIQSRYVKNGRLEDHEIKFAVEQIEKVMETTMSLVSIHTVEEEPRLVTRLNRLEPVGGEAGKEITIRIYGQNLLGDSPQKKEREGMVAINHVPVHQAGMRWTEREVAFRLPGETSASAPDRTAWISLFVDGMETNALPFHLVRKGS